MKVFLRDIPPDGLELARHITASDIDLPQDNFTVASPIELVVFLNKVGDEVIGHVEAKGKYIFNCARCLEQTEQVRDDKFEFFVDIDPTTEFVELTSEIREELIIALSSVVLCQKDCRGMCPRCGMNLNKEKCVCK